MDNIYCMTDDVIEFLKSYQNFEINMSINDLIKSNSYEEQQEIIEYIIKETKIKKPCDLSDWIMMELAKLVNCVQHK